MENNYGVKYYYLYYCEGCGYYSDDKYSDYRCPICNYRHSKENPPEEQCEKFIYTEPVTVKTIIKEFLLIERKGYFENKDIRYKS